MGSSARVHCKACKVWMPRLEWMTKKECDNPNCTCPEVKKMVKRAAEVIDKARGSSRNSIQISTSFVPDNNNEVVDQYFIEVPKVMTMIITPPNARNVPKKK
jgi:hypothetical protein